MLPFGPSYVAPAKFLAHADAWMVEAWSLVAERIEVEEDGQVWVATVRFLMPDAPHIYLIDDAEFEYYEGHRCVASGRILQLL